MRLFQADWVNWMLQTMKIPDDEPIENKRVTGAIASAQAQVEARTSTPARTSSSTTTS